MESQISGSGEFTAGRWSDQEQELFIFGIMRHGKDWKKVETLIKSRNSSQIRSHAQKFFIKVQHIRKVQKKSKYKAKPKTCLFSEEETKLIDMLRSQTLTDRTPPDITALLNEDGKRKTAHITTAEKQNEQLENPPSSPSKKNQDYPDKGSQANFCLLGVPIGKLEIFQKSMRERKQNSYQSQSYFFSLIRSNFLRFLSTPSVLDLVDLPHPNKSESQQKIKGEQLFEQIQIPELIKMPSKSMKSIEMEEQRKQISLVQQQQNQLEDIQSNP